MFRRLGFCAAAAFHQSAAVRAAAPASLAHGMAAAEGSFNISSVASSFLADRVTAPAIRPHPFPMFFVDVAYPSGSVSSFIVRPQRPLFFSTDHKPELPCSNSKKESQKAAPFVMEDDGVKNAKQDGCAGDVTGGTKVDSFKDVEDHCGKKHPSGDQIGVKAVATGDEEGVKIFTEENIAVVKGDEDARAKAETSKAPLTNADHVAGAKSEADGDGMAAVDKNHEGAIATDPRINASLNNVVADFLAGTSTTTDLLDGVNVPADGAYEAVTSEEIGEEDRTGGEQETGENPKKNGTGSEQKAKQKPKQNSTGGEHDAGEKAKQNGTEGEQCIEDDLPRIVSAAKRRFRRTSKANMNMAAHFANHRAFVVGIVNKTSATVIEAVRVHMYYSVVEIKRYLRATRIYKGLATFLAILLAGMLVFYHGVNFLVEKLEALFEATASSDFTKNKAREILYYAVGGLTPLRMAQVVVGWPWFDGAKKDEPAKAKPKSERSFWEWIWSVFGFGGGKK